MAGKSKGNSIVIRIDGDNSGFEKSTKETVKSAKSQAAKLAAEYRKAGMTQSEAMKKAWSEVERTSKNSSKKVQSDIKDIGDRAEQSGKEISESLGGKLKSSISTALSGIAIGSAVTGGIGTAIKTGIDFESAFAGVQKTVDATTEELSAMRQGLRDMSLEMPMTASGLAGIAESAGQLGIQNENILSFTKTMADLGVATNLSGEEAAQTLARLANITGMSQENFDRMGSTIVALGNNLATTESEIAEMALRLAGAGSQVGMSEAQILSFAGALSSVGIEAEAGGTAFSTVMTQMQLAAETGGESLDNFAKVAGMSAQEFKTAFQNDAAGAIMKFVEGLASSEDRGLSAIKVLNDMGITEIRMRDALLRASGATDVFTKALDTGTDAWKENTALAKEAEQRYGTMESQLGIMKNSAQDLGITIYEGLQEPLAAAVKSGTKNIKELTKSFENGGLKDALENVGELAGSFVDTFIEIATVAIPPVTEAIGFLGENLEIVVPLIAAGVLAIKGWAIGKSIATAISASSAALTVFNTAMEASTAATAFSAMMDAAKTSGITAQNIAVGLLSGQYGILTAAQMLAAKAGAVLSAVWAANPVGVVVAGIAALVAVLGVAYVAMNKETEAEKARREAIEQSVEETNALTDAMEQQKASYENNLQNIQNNTAAQLVELDQTRLLADELMSLADENGRVTEASKERAAYILGELNAALGTEYEMTGNQIQKFSDLKESIYDVIEAEEARVIVSAYSDMMADAIKNEIEAKDKAREATQKLTTQQELQNGIVQDYIDELYERSKIYISEEEAIRRLSQTQGTLEMGLDHLREQYQELDASIEANTQIVEESGAASMDAEQKKLDYQNAVNAQLEGNYEKLGEMASFSAEQRKAIESENGQEILTAIESNNKAIEALEKQKANAATEEMRRGCQDQIDELKAYGGELETRYREVGGQGAEGFRATRPEFESAAGYSGDGIVGSLLGLKPKVYNAGYSLGLRAKAGYDAAQNINSPSKEMMKSGAYTVDGLLIGLQKKENAVYGAGYTLGESAIDGAEKAQKLAKRAGELFPENFAEGMAENEEAATEQFDELLEVLEHRRKLDLINEADYYEQLKTLRDTYLAEGTKEHAQYTEKIYDYYKGLAEDQAELLEEQKDTIQSIYDEIESYATERYDEIAQAQENIASKLQSFGGLFEEVDFGELGSFKVFNNFEDEIAVLDEYGRNMLALKDRLRENGYDDGIIQGFFAEFENLDVMEASNMARMLNSKSGAEFSEIVGSWADYQKKVQEVSGNLYAEERAAVEKEVEALADFTESELGKYGAKIPENFFNFGEDSAKQFGEGFLEKLSQVMADINQKISASFGALLPSAAAAGNSYVDNRSTTIIAPAGTSPAALIEQQNQNELYQQHTRGW